MTDEYPEACGLGRNGECPMCGRTCDEEMRRDCMRRIIEKETQAMDGLVGLLKQTRNLLTGSGAESGYCMCGDSVESHGIGSGHAPVDSHAYYAGQLVEQIDSKLAALAALKATP